MKEGCRLGIDSHADMSCAGKHAQVMEEYHGRTCNVQPFHDGYNAIENVSTVNAAFAHDTEQGETLILHLKQSLNLTSARS